MNNSDHFRIWCVGGEDVHFRIPFLKELRVSGFDVGAAGSVAGPAFEQEKIEYHSYPLKRGLGPLSDLLSIFTLARLLRRHKVDLVHAFDTKPGLFVPIAARLAGIPVAMRTIAGMGYVFSSNSLLAMILRPVYCLLQALISRASDMTVFQNSDDESFFLSNRLTGGKKHQLVLSSGIDLAAFERARMDVGNLDGLRRDLGLEGKVVFILVARLVKSKGVAEYLEAASLVKKKHENAVFLLVGPRESEGIEAVSERLLEKHADSVRYLGRRSDVPQLLALSDVFVLPTYYREGVPRVLLEAGAMGLPLITTDMPGCRDVVFHEWNGLLVSARDANSLAASIAWMIDHVEERLEMGRRNRTHIIPAHFDLKLVTKAYSDIYTGLLNGKVRSSRI
jgi:glycosyltransferase involved in cell wall biosynthesis